MITKAYEELYIKTSDGIKIAVNHFKRDKDQVLVIANGWTMSKDSKFIKEMSELFANSVDVISFDFRGHGKSSGLYTFTQKEPKDLKAIFNYAKTHYKKIYLIGFSLGGAISILYSAEETFLEKLIIVSAPHSIARIRYFKWLKDFLRNPFCKYEFKKWAKLRPFPILWGKKRPIDFVDKVSVPTLFIAGELDTIIPYEDTKSLFYKAQCEKEFILFRNCYHAEDLLHNEKEKFVKTCTQWLLAEEKILEQVLV